MAAISVDTDGASTTLPTLTIMTFAAPGHPLRQARAITTTGTHRHEVLGVGTTFTLTAPLATVTEATLHVTALGVHETSLNGTPVRDSVLDPGWTAYEWRLPVDTLDVLPLLRDGNNTLDARLGGGWWRGDLGFEGANANYGEDTAYLAVLEIRYADGSSQLVPTDPSWLGHRTDSPEASLYGGQRIDARRRGSDHPTTPVRVVDLDLDLLVPRVSPPVRRHESLAPLAVWTSPTGRTLLDFGQNLVGRLRVRCTGPAGAEVTLRHAEVLEHGELGTRPLRGARATDTFVLSGAEDVFEPTMTFHGFRYVEVTGWPGELTLEGARAAIEAVVVHSAMERTGWFECSDPDVNRLVENAVWSQRGNFLAVPTDCPQRDERLGWTGDLAVFAPTAAYGFDVADFLHGWLLDLAEETRHQEHGWVPHVVPDVLKHGHFSPEFTAMITQWQGATCIWGDAAVWVPEALWRAYGALDRLGEHYPAMVLHLDGVERALSPTGLWDSGFQFGDWLDPDASPHEPWNAKANAGVVATACLHRSARFAAEAAGLLGLAADAERWTALADRTRAAFQQHYVTGGGARIRSDCATVYALAICFGLLDDDEAARSRAGARLAEVVAAADHRVTTGFAGTPYVTWALSETGHVDTAYRLLLERESPSWLHPVTMGATTIWERWDSMLPDGSINPGDMTSFNHYALGAVADWLYGVVAGIRPTQPGYAAVQLAPTPGPGLDWANGALETRHGRVECGWRRVGEGDGGGFVVEVLVPEGCLLYTSPSPRD